MSSHKSLRERLEYLEKKYKCITCTIATGGLGGGAAYLLQDNEGSFQLTENAVPIGPVINLASVVQDNIYTHNQYRTVGASLRLAQMAQVINNGPLITIAEDEIHFFRNNVFQVNQGGPPTRYTDIYVLRNLGKGTYGTGGTITVTRATLRNLGSTNTTVADIEDLASTQFIDLGDVGITDITTAFNAYDFSVTPGEDPIQAQEDGYVLIDVIINGEALQYLFVGTGGDYGTTGTETAVDEDFVLLTDLGQLASTQFIDVGDIGSLTIEDGFNAHDFSIAPGEEPVQDQVNGYVIVDSIMEGTPTQHLFVGAGGFYGTGPGGVETAVALDFLSYTAVVTTPANDVWRNNAGTAPASAYTESIRHDGQVSMNRKVWVGGGSSYGIQNQGSTWLYVRGNQGVDIRAVNPNVGDILLTSTGTFTVPFITNQTKYNVRAGRLFNDTQINNDFKTIGVEINDTVNFTQKTGTSYYVALRINPTIQDGTTNQHYAIQSLTGKVEFTTDSIEAPGYTIAQINAIGPKAIPTVEWYNANVSPFQALDEGSGIGYIIRGSNRANYGNVGLGAFDFGYYFTDATQGATGIYSFNLGGEDNNLSGYNATANGYGNIGDDSYNTLFGFRNHASDYGSMCFGAGLISKTNMAVVVGTANVDYIFEAAFNMPLHPIFIVGNGAMVGGSPPTAGARSDALTVLRNGKVGIGQDDFGHSAGVSGSQLLHVEGGILGTVYRGSSYGSGTVTGTATYMLAVDATGNMIEEALPVGGGGEDLDATLTIGNTTTQNIIVSRADNFGYLESNNSLNGDYAFMQPSQFYVEDGPTLNSAYLSPSGFGIFDGVTGFGIDFLILPMTVSNKIVTIRSLAGTMALLSDNRIVYVNTSTGDDGTAQLGNQELPFLTVNGAHSALPTSAAEKLVLWEMRFLNAATITISEPLDDRNLLLNFGDLVCTVNWGTITGNFTHANSNGNQPFAMIGINTDLNVTGTSGSTLLNIGDVTFKLNSITVNMTNNNFGWFRNSGHVDIEVEDFIIGANQGMTFGTVGAGPNRINLLVKDTLTDAGTGQSYMTSDNICVFDINNIVKTGTGTVVFFDGMGAPTVDSLDLTIRGELSGAGTGTCFVTRNASNGSQTRVHLDGINKSSTTWIFTTSNGDQGDSVWTGSMREGSEGMRVAGNNTSANTTFKDFIGRFATAVTVVNAHNYRFYNCNITCVEHFGVINSGSTILLEFHGTNIIFLEDTGTYEVFTNSNGAATVDIYGIVYTNEATLGTDVTANNLTPNSF